MTDAQIKARLESEAGAWARRVEAERLAIESNRRRLERNARNIEILIVVGAMSVFACLVGLAGLYFGIWK